MGKYCCPVNSSHSTMAKVYTSVRASATSPRAVRAPNRRRAEHHPGLRLLFFQLAARQPEVGQFHVAVVAEQNVGRRDVPVDQLEIAGSHARSENRATSRASAADSMGCAAECALNGSTLTQILAFHISMAM